MPEIINSLIANIGFIFERLNWLSLVDLFLVTAVFFAILQLLRGTQAMVLLRGILLLIALIGVLTSLDVLPAFSWLVQTTLPALLLAIPVIFAPEIRRALERLGAPEKFSVMTVRLPRPRISSARWSPLAAGSPIASTAP